MSSNRQSHPIQKTRILIFGLVLLVVAGTWLAITLGEMQKHASLLEALPLPTPTLVPTATSAPGQLHTRYLTGTYPSSWWYGSDSILYHPQYPNVSSAFWGCSDNGESDEIGKAAVGHVYFIICPTHLSDPETVLETVAPNTDSSAIKYTPHSAMPAVRFGMQGLKGTWMRGVQDTYVPEYFEVYARNNLLLIISTPYGDNKAFEDVLANIKPDL